MRGQALGRPRGSRTTEQTQQKLGKVKRAIMGLNERFMREFDKVVEENKRDRRMR